MNNTITLLVRLTLIICLLGLSSILAARLVIERTALNRTFSDPEQLPNREVGLVLGCAKEVGGAPNWYFIHRVNAAARLYHAQKINHILVSGDNRHPGYNEPADMKNALIAQGVPAEDITCDYAGLATLDSIVRADKVFGQQSFTVISQSFHTKRAIFIATQKGLNVVGFNAPDIARAAAAPTLLREELARVKTILDLWILHRKPRFLGPPVLITPRPSEA
jgi:SanA protein